MAFEIEKDIRSNLLDAIKNNSLVIIAGAGISKSAGLPTWSELIHLIIERLIIDYKEFGEILSDINNDVIPDSEKFMLILQEIEKQEAIKLKVNGIISNELNKIIDYSLLHVKIMKLSQKIVSLNLDNIFETTRGSIFGINEVLTSENSLLDKILNQKKFLIKIHGNINMRNSWVFYPSEYQKKYKLTSDDKSIKALKNLIYHNTTLFLGISMQDIYVNEIFMQVFSDTQGIQEPNYILKKTTENVPKHFTSGIDCDDIINQTEEFLDELLRLSGRNLQNLPKVEFIHFTIEYWEQKEKEYTHEDLIKFYTTTGKNHDVVAKIVSQNNLINTHVYDLIPIADNELESKKNEYRIISLLSEDFAMRHFFQVVGVYGEGKTVYLFKLAKMLYSNHYDVFLLYGSSCLNSELDLFFDSLKISIRPILLLFDDLDYKNERIDFFLKRISEILKERKLVIISTCKQFNDTIEEHLYNFDFVVKRASLPRNNSDANEMTLRNLFIDLAKFEKKTQDKLKNISRKSMWGNNVKLLTLTKFSKAAKQPIKYPWQDWEIFAKNNCPQLKDLYLLISIFQKYDITLPIKTCIFLLDLESTFQEIFDFFKLNSEFIKIKNEKGDIDICLQVPDNILAEMCVYQKDLELSNTKFYFEKSLEDLNPEKDYLIRHLINNDKIFKIYSTNPDEIIDKSLFGFLNSRSFYAHYIENRITQDINKNEKNKNRICLYKYNKKKNPNYLQDILSEESDNYRAITSLAVYHKVNGDFTKTYYYLDKLPFDSYVGHVYMETIRKENEDLKDNLLAINYFKNLLERIYRDKVIKYLATKYIRIFFELFKEKYPYECLEQLKKISSIQNPNLNLASQAYFLYASNIEIEYNDFYRKVVENFNTKKLLRLYDILIEQYSKSENFSSKNKMVLLKVYQEIEAIIKERLPINTEEHNIKSEKLIGLLHREYKIIRNLIKFKKLNKVDNIDFAYVDLIKKRNYLMKALFKLDKKNPYSIEPIVQYLKDSKRFRLAKFFLEECLPNYYDYFDIEKLHKQIDKFLETRESDNLIAIKTDLIGLYVKKNSSIICGNETIKFMKDSVLHKSKKEEYLVFFSIFKDNSGMLFADKIEPYYSLEDSFEGEKPIDIFEMIGLYDN
jgi:hypothetical protein